MPRITSKNHKKLNVWIVAAVTTPVIILAVFGAFAFQVPQYSYYYVKCGYKQPIKAIGNGGYKRGGVYILPNHRDYHGQIFTNAYYCTEEEALGDGHRRL